MFLVINRAKCDSDQLFFLPQTLVKTSPPPRPVSGV